MDSGCSETSIKAIKRGSIFKKNPLSGFCLCISLNSLLLSLRESQVKSKKFMKNQTMKLKFLSSFTLIYFPRMTFIKRINDAQEIEHKMVMLTITRTTLLLSFLYPKKKEKREMNENHNSHRENSNRIAD